MFAQQRTHTFTRGTIKEKMNILQLLKVYISVTKGYNSGNIIFDSHIDPRTLLMYNTIQCIYSALNIKQCL